MDITLFPFDVIEKILWYLNKDDVYTCLKISEWRDCIDSRSICKNFLTYHPDYFEKQIQHSTISPENNLEQEVTAKECKQLVKEKCVEKNVTHNNYHLEPIIYPSDVFVDNVLDAVDKRGRHWLFVSFINQEPYIGEHKIQVFSTECNLQLRATIPTSRGITNPMLGSSFEFNVNFDTLYHMYDMSILVMAFELNKESITVLQMKLICVEDIWVHSLNLNPCAHYRAAFTHIGEQHQFFIHSAYHMNLEIEPSVLIVNDEGHVLQKDSNHDIYQIDLGRCFPVPTVSVSVENSLVLVCIATQVPNKLRYCIYDAKQNSFLQFNISVSRTECYNLKGTTVFIANWVDSGLNLSCYSIKNSETIYTMNANRYCHMHLFSETVLITGYKKSLSAIDVTNGAIIWEYTMDCHPFLLKFFNISKNIFALGVQHCGQVTYEMWDAIRGQPLSCPFSLGDGLVPLMNASYIRQYQPPPWIVFYTDPDSRYSQQYRRSFTSIFVLMYW